MTDSRCNLHCYPSSSLGGLLFFLIYQQSIHEENDEEYPDGYLSLSRRVKRRRRKSMYCRIHGCRLSCRNNDEEDKR